MIYLKIEISTERKEKMKSVKLISVILLLCLLIPSLFANSANSDFVQIAQPEINVIGGMTFTARAETKEALDGIISAKTKPACVIFNVTSDGKVADTARTTPYASLDEAVTALGGVIMPAFYITTEQEADALKAYLGDNDIDDAFVISADPSLVLNVRKKIKMSRGIIDFTDAYKDKASVTEEDLLAMRSKANESMATIVIIPSNIATRDTVKYITDRLVTVWINESSPLTSTAQAYKLITAGPHGVIADNTELLVKVATEYIKKNSVIRTPLNIGHRGIPSRAPENTVEGALLAYEQGADVIEIDIYLTKDNEIVIMHDANTGRTCDKDLTVESSTLAQLEELYVNKGFENNEKFKNCRIPTLQDFYEAFKDKDAQIFVEIKSTNQKIVDRLKEITDEYGMEDQISVITFHTSQIQRMKKKYPTMSVGYLTGNVTGNSGTGAEKVEKVLKHIQRFGTTYNPGYSGLTEDYVINANMRGITTWPWTFTDKNEYHKFFFAGFNGMTSNNAYFVEDFAKFVDCEQYEYILKPGEVHTVKASVTTYNRQTSPLFTDNSNRSRIIVLEGGENVEISGDQIRFKSDSGTFAYAVEYTHQITRQKTYTVYSQPVYLTVESESTQAPETSADTSSDTTDANASAPVAAIVAVPALGVAIVAVGVVLIVRSKKKN